MGQGDIFRENKKKELDWKKHLWGRKGTFQENEFECE